MPRPVVLIVDDEPDIRELLAITLSRMEIESKTAPDIAGAKRLLASERFDLCLTDMHLPDGNGLDLVEWMQNNAAQVPVAVITAHGNVESAVRALKLGAFDFVSKPLDLADLRKLVGVAIKISARDDSQPRQETDTGLLFKDRLLGRSPAIKTLREMIVKVARSQAPVHINGESGSGKELVARLIHDVSPRGDGPF